MKYTGSHGSVAATSPSLSSTACLHTFDLCQYVQSQSLTDRLPDEVIAPSNIKISNIDVGSST